jgi:hypothetical protein
MMMAANNTPNSAASVKVDVQQLAKKLVKNRASRLAPSMGVITKTGESGR